ncbi:hypothetical protein Droror1_Dr00023941 [Drosera rotundifolia]
MAFDHNLIPKDLRPLNMTRVSSDEPRIAAVSTSGRPVEGIYSDAGYGGGLGFGNPGAGVGLGPFVANRGPRMPVPVEMPVVSMSGYVSSPNVGPRISGNFGQVGEDGREDSVSGKKVKFLCSFGGKILPRPSDGMLRYVGGQTRIVGVRRDVRFSEFSQKMVDMFGQPAVIKYQLPDEDLDALVSVSSPDDLENMMDEYEKLAERSPDGSAKLRMFLFSSSDLESSGAMGFGDLQDGGQRYVDAVNGIMEGVGGGITRKESIASVTSNQNSDVSGAEAADTTLIPADIAVPPPATVVSPKGDNPSSNDNMARIDGSSASHPDSHAAVLPVSNAKSSPKAVSSQPEIMLEKPVAIPAQQQQTGYDLQQPGARYIPPPSSYLQGYADAHQDSVNLAEFQKLCPPQVVYANPQVVPSPGQMLIRPQYHETTATFAPQPFIPPGPIAMTPSSHLSMNPNMMHPLVQQRVFAPSADQSYTSYQAQVPPAGIGGSYGWHQVTPQNHMGYSEGWIPNPQVMLSDKLPRVAECYYCQKQLPHAHSDTVVQDERDSSMTMVGTNPAYHSVNVADLTGVIPGSKIIAGGPVGEVTLEQASGTGVRALAKTKYEGGSPQGEITGAPRNSEAQHEIDSAVLRRVDDSDLVKMLASQNVSTGLPDVQASLGITKGDIPQLLSEDATQKHLIPPVGQVKQEIRQEVKQEVSMSKVATTAIGNASVKKPELIDMDTAKDYTVAIPRVASREDAAAAAISYENMRAIDSIKQLHVSPPEVLPSNEQSKLLVEPPRKDDIYDHKSQHILGKEATPSDILSKPMVSEMIQTKPVEVMPYSAVDVSYQHMGILPEAYEVSQVPIFGMDDPTTFQQSAAPAGLDNLTTGNKVQPSLSQPNWGHNILDTANSLFSNQDPWNLHHDPHFPPMPNKIITRKENTGTRDSHLENRPGNGAEANMEMHLLDVIDYPTGHVNKDYISKQPQVGKEFPVQVSPEEIIKQELQGTAEGVAASVFQSSAPPTPVLGLERELQLNSDAAAQAKLEGVNIKSEVSILGLPLPNLGRLQIIKNSDLEELRELGSGTFGTVYHGKWRGSDVAIKRINERCFSGKPSEQDRMRDDFWNEAINLADLHHPNVVAFYGVVLDGPGGSVATVTEYMVNGSLRTALHERNLDKRKRLLIAMDVAFGMEYLHSKSIVHFDLKSDNLLVNLRDPHRPICKVGDLGLSKVKCQTLISGGVRGTLPWMAPELLNGTDSLVSEKVDVFSFGIVMWELLTGDEPYRELHYGNIIGGIVNNTLRPAVPDGCDPDWRSLMERCWSAEPSERPSFPEIANELRSMATKLQQKGQTTATNTRTNA